MPLTLNLDGRIDPSQIATHRCLYYTPSLFATRLMLFGRPNRPASQQALFSPAGATTGTPSQHYRLLGTSNFSVFSCAAITRAISVSIALVLTGLAI